MDKLSLTFIKNYKNDEKLRKSFNELATEVFGINFEDWYQKGFWNNRYVPYSYIDGDKVIANVSVNLLDFVIDGKNKSAIQIGTVMTHPNYRNKGLSTSLMNTVLEEYEGNYDFIYLFANQNVLDFYPKFGFDSFNEYQFSMPYLSTHSDKTGIRKLDGNNMDDINLIYKIATERLPVSNLFGTINTQDLLMFYCIYVFESNIYYIEEESAIVIFEQEDKQVDIYDIVSNKEVNIVNVLSKITNSDTNKIVFHFTPDYKGINAQSELFNGDDVFFIKMNGNDNYFPSELKYPITTKV